VEAGRLDVRFGRRLPFRTAEQVDAEPTGQLREPWTDGAVVAESVEMLVRAREDLLEDVLGVARLEPEALDADRVDVTREALDELAPGIVVPLATTRDEPGVA